MTGTEQASDNQKVTAEVMDERGGKNDPSKPTKKKAAKKEGCCRERRDDEDLCTYFIAAIACGACCGACAACQELCPCDLGELFSG